MLRNQRRPDRTVRLHPTSSTLSVGLAPPPPPLCHAVTRSCRFAWEHLLRGLRCRCMRTLATIGGATPVAEVGWLVADRGPRLSAGVQLRSLLVRG